MSTPETSMLLATGYLLTADPDEPGDEAEQPDDEDEDERRAPGPLERRRLGVADRHPELLEDVRRQRGLRVLVGRPGERVELDPLLDPDQQQQRSGLAGDPGDAEHDAGDDAG